MSQHIEVFEQSGEYGWKRDGRFIAYGFKTEASAKTNAKNSSGLYRTRLKWTKVSKDQGDGHTIVAELRA